MYNKFGSKQMLYALTVFSIFQCLITTDVGIYIGAHIREKEDGKLETFNDTISKQGKLMNLDIYVSHGADGDKKISYVNAMNFDTTLPMYVGTCPKGEDISQAKSIQDLAKKGCTVDENSYMYFNIEQLSLVQIQQGNDSQRCSYGGVNYSIDQLSSEVSQNPTYQFRFKNIFYHGLSKIANSEQLIAQAKLAAQTKASINTAFKYTLMKKIAEEKRQDLFCPFNLDCQESAITETDYKFLTLGDKANMLVIEVDKSQCSSQNIFKAQAKKDQPLLIKQLENANLGIDTDLLEYQEIEVVNHQMHFQFDNDQLAVSIKEDRLNQQEGFSKNQEWRFGQFFREKVQSTQNGFLKLGEFKKKDIRIQIMACLGFVFPSPKGNLLSQFLKLGCENIHSIDGIFTQADKNDRNEVIKRLEEKQNKNELDVKDFKLEKVALNKNGSNHSIEIKGFMEHCDLLYDTLLSVLFVLCYLKYAAHGNFMNLQKSLDIDENKRKLFSKLLETKNLETPVLEGFKFEKSRRMLERYATNRLRILGQEDECCTESCLKKTCCECQIQLCAIVCAHAICACLFWICEQGLKAFCSGGRLRILSGEQIQQQLGQALQEDFAQYKNIVKLFQGKKDLPYSEMKGILDNNSHLMSKSKKYQDQMFVLISQLPADTSDTVEIDGKKININKETSEIMSAGKEITKEVDNNEQRVRLDLLVI